MLRQKSGIVQLLSRYCRLYNSVILRLSFGYPSVIYRNNTRRRQGKDKDRIKAGYGMEGRRKGGGKGTKGGQKRDERGAGRGRKGDRSGTKGGRKGDGRGAEEGRKRGGREKRGENCGRETGKDVAG